MVKTTDTEWLKNERLNTQRWEDEGGQMLENNDFIPDRTVVQLVPIHIRRHVASLQWNERFIIEPFRPGNGIIREHRLGKGKSDG